MFPTKNNKFKISESTEYTAEFGRRQGTLKKKRSQVINVKLNAPVDYPRVAMLPASEFARIQDSLNRVNKEQEHAIAAAREREALHQRSIEAVRDWTNTIVGQRKKRLEAKKIREEIAEEKLKQLDLEEAKFQAQQRKDMIERAKVMQFNQIDRVKKFHGAMLMTEVMKEREAQIELKKRKENAAKEIDKENLVMITHNQEKSLEQEQLKALEKKKNCLANAESLEREINEHRQATEKEKLKKKKEAEDLKMFLELYHKEQVAHRMKKEEGKRKIMHGFQEHFANKKISQKNEAEKQKREEVWLRCIVKARDQTLKLRKEKEAERFRAAQRYKQVIADKLARQKERDRDRILDEDQLISKAAAEAEAKRDELQREKDEQRATMLKSIAEHREAVQTQQQKMHEEEKKLPGTHNTQKIAMDFEQDQQSKAQRMKEIAKTLKDTHVHQMAVKRAKEQHIKNQENESEARTARFLADDENEFQDYAQNAIEKAIEAKRTGSIMEKAKMEGTGQGVAPGFKASEPWYLVQHPPKVPLPSSVCCNAKDIKELKEDTNIQAAKHKLGFTW